MRRIKYLWVFLQSSCIPYLNLNISNHPEWPLLRHFWWGDNQGWFNSICRLRGNCYISDWLRVITWPGTWPLIGWQWSRDLDTGLWLVPGANVSCGELIKQIWSRQAWTYFQQTWKITVIGLSKPSKYRTFIESSRSGHKTIYNTIWIRTPACLYCEETLLEITLLETWGGPMVSVRMMRMKIIGTIVAKLRAARSRCGYADYLPNILKCSGIPGRSLSEKTVTMLFLLLSKIVFPG